MSEPFRAKENAGKAAADHDGPGDQESFPLSANTITNH